MMKINTAITFLALFLCSATAHAVVTFDWATVVMGLHEMPADARLPVLHELSRVARTLVVIIYILYPLVVAMEALNEGIALQEINRFSTEAIFATISLTAGTSDGVIAWESFHHDNRNTGSLSVVLDAVSDPP